MATLEEMIEVGQMAKEFALKFKNCYGHYPLIVGFECYEHFGETAEIVEVNMFDKVRNAEVVVQGRGADQTDSVEFGDLSWRR